MTTAADDTAVEEAFEAYLAGRPVPSEGAGVAAFAAAVRATATEPGRPNAALAELLATGLLIDQSAPSPKTAPTRRRRRLAMFFPALLAKLLSAGAIAQAATGAGVAVVVVCSAGAAGVLPDSVQETFSSIVGTETDQPETVDPAPVDDGTVDPVPAGDGTVDPAPVEDGTADQATNTSDTGFDPTQPLGPQIAGKVEHGEVDGQRVSDMAHQRNEQRRNQGAEDSDTAEDGDDAADDGTTEAGDDQGSGGDTTGEVTTQNGGSGRGGQGRHGNG